MNEENQAVVKGTVMGHEFEAKLGEFEVEMDRGSNAIGIEMQQHGIPILFVYSRGASVDKEQRKFMVAPTGVPFGDIKITWLHIGSFRRPSDNRFFHVFEVTA